MDKWRDRKYLLLLYPEDPTHVKAMELIETSGYQYCGILHNKDTWDVTDDDLGDHEPGSLKKPHWHLVIKFKQARWSTALETELGIAPNYIRKCNSLDASLLYLIHDGFPDKYQYEFTEVFGNLAPALAKLLVADDEGSRVLEIVKFIDDEQGFMTYRKALIMACENGLYGEFRRLGSGVKFLIDEHNASVESDTGRCLRPTAGAYADARDLGMLDGLFAAHNQIITASDIRNNRF